jgi:thiamine pyrophosphate-dependent acetolactate synthase large subunit-like protein
MSSNRAICSTSWKPPWPIVLLAACGVTSFWDCAHESNAALIADGYSRVTGKMAMAVAQNGPGVTGFVTAIKTAYWNHTPMLLVTPQAANKTIQKSRGILICAGAQPRHAFSITRLSTSATRVGSRAYWNHTPMLLVTPQAANKTIGQGGFQEVEQMALFEDMVCYPVRSGRPPSPSCRSLGNSRRR